MGKLKRRGKNQKARTNPIKGKENSSKDENLRQTKILPLIEKLLLLIPNDKSMAIAAINVLCEDEHMRHLLLKEKLISTVMEKCLNDSNDEILVESYGLLRNVGIEEGYDVLIYYWRSGIWTAIESAMSKIETSFNFLLENAPKDKSKLQLLYDFTENVLSLIDTLACGSEELHTQILEKLPPILDIVKKLITNQIGSGSYKVSNQLFISLLAFIYGLSVESDDFIRLANFDFAAVDNYITNTPGFAQTSWGHLAAVYVEAIKFNNLEIAGIQVPVVESFTRTSNLLTTIDLNDLKNRIIKYANVDNAKPEPKEGSTIVKELNKQAAEKNQTKYELSTIEVALDLLSSLLEYCASQDQDISVTKSTVYDVVLHLIEFELNNQTTLKLLNKMVVTMNNFVWLLVTLNTGTFDCSRLWELLTQIQSPEMDLQKNTLNALTGCFRLHDFSSQSVAMIDPLISTAERLRNIEDDEEALSLYEAIVEFLGLATSSVEDVSIVRKVGPFVVSSAQYYVSKSDPLAMEVVLNSIDAIFEIFGSDKVAYDQYYAAENLNERLVAIEKDLKVAYKMIDKNKYGNLKLRAEEVWRNVQRFIQYKSS